VVAGVELKEQLVLNLGNEVGPPLTPKGTKHLASEETKGLGPGGVWGGVISQHCSRIFL